MIKNERQYRITKSQADKFRQALSQLHASPQFEQLHPILRKAQEDALRSQLDELQAQLSAYDALRSGKLRVIEVESFAELPRALIQARIAAGLSQRDLADRLGLKEQQIQQYESTEYTSASMARVREVIDALGILVREEIFLPSAEVSKAKLFQRMQSIGIDRDLILTKILPRPLAAQLQAETRSANHTLGSAVLQAAATLSRVFDLKLSNIFGSEQLRLNTSALGAARFKLPARVDEQKMSAYTVYAHYLALLVLDTTRALEPKPVPTNPHQVHEAIVSRYGSITFEHILRYIWSLGIPVLPLSAVGSFHGACWRVKGRNVIVIKQQTRFSARWLNDGLHELGHAGQKPEEQERTIVETEDIIRNRRNSDEEEEAQLFAEDVIFDGRADEIAEICVERARGAIERLSSVVPQVAAEEHVPADALANHIAYRLSEQGQNWWGAATNLQDKRINPWQIARDVFLEYADLSVINEADRTLLLQALTEIVEE